MGTAGPGSIDFVTGLPDWGPLSAGDVPPAVGVFLGRSAAEELLSEPERFCPACFFAFQFWKRCRRRLGIEPFNPVVVDGGSLEVESWEVLWPDKCLRNELFLIELLVSGFAGFGGSL